MAEPAWTLDEPVGDGPHGTIWLARDDSGNQALLEVASGPEGEPAIRLRGMRMSRVRHPFLMRVDGVTRVDEHSALVAEPFAGTGLDGLMAQGAMPLACAVDLGRKVARALFAAYDRAPSGKEPHGLIHGDLAPGDVFVDVGGNVRLHGLGMRPGRGETDGPVALTDRPISPWSAPETLDGSSPRHASDVYALGAMLCQLMTGEPPPWASSSPDWHTAAALGAAKRMTELSGEEAFGELIEGMLAHDPAARPRAEEVEKTLARLHRRLDRGALAEWCASAVPAAIEDAALRRQLEAESLEAAGRGEDVDTAEIEPVGLPQDDPPSEEEPVSQRSREALDDEDTLEAPVSRKLWQIRAQTDAQRPRPLEWEDPSREDTGVVDPADLREEVPDPLAEDESEVLPMDTGRFVLDEATGELVQPDASTLGMAVVPAGEDDDDPSEAEATALGDDDRPAPPKVPQAPAAGSSAAASPDDVPTLHDVNEAIEAERKQKQAAGDSPEAAASAAMAAGATSTAALAAAAAQARAAGPAPDQPAAAESSAAESPAAESPAAESPAVAGQDAGWDEEEAFFGGRGIDDAQTSTPPPASEEPAAPPPAARPAAGLAPPPPTEGAGMNGWWLAVLASVALVVVMVWFTRQQQPITGPDAGARVTAPQGAPGDAQEAPAGTEAPPSGTDGPAQGAATDQAADPAAAAAAAAEVAAAEAAAAEAAAAASPEGAAAEAAARRDAQEAADRQDAEAALAAEGAAAARAEQAAAALAAEEAAAARAAQEEAAARAAEQEAARRAAERAAAEQAAADRAAAAQQAATERAAAQQAAADRAAADRAAAERAAAERAAAERAAAQQAEAAAAQRAAADRAAEERAAAAAAQQAAAAAAQRAAAQQAAAAAERAAQEAAAQEAAAQPASGDATVVITGDADGVVLSGSPGRFSGGPVPPGSYTVQATFGVNTVDVGSVDIAAGQKVTVKCNASFMRCTVR